MHSCPYPKTPSGVAGQRAFLALWGETIMKRLFTIIFSILLLCLAGCSTAAEVGYTQIDQDTAKEMMAGEVIYKGTEYTNPGIQKQA